jgi:proprotein convertase subtilisin/kexin type 5
MKKTVCAKCADLFQGCIECISTDSCLVCQNDYFLFGNYCLPRCSGTEQPILDLAQRKCLKNCESGNFLKYNETLNSNICHKCQESCEECSYENSCSTCKLGYVFQNNTCGKTCGNGEFPNWALKICSPCKLEELSIISNTGVSCGKCQHPCRSCLISPQQCTSCIPGLYWGNSSCLPNCQEGFYPLDDFGVCDRCNSNCKTCINKGSKSCASCSDQLFFLNGECLEKCPGSYFGNNQSRACEPCHFSCAKCAGENKMDCLECPESRFLSNETDSLIGECKCLHGFFENNEKNCGGIFAFFNEILLY